MFRDFSHFAHLYFSRCAMREGASASDARAVVCGSRFRDFRDFSRFSQFFAFFSRFFAIFRSRSRIAKNTGVQNDYNREKYRCAASVKVADTVLNSWSSPSCSRKTTAKMKITAARRISVDSTERTARAMPVFLSLCTPVFYAILVPAHLYFSRCASERERSERERCASSRVPFANSRNFGSNSHDFDNKKKS